MSGYYNRDAVRAGREPFTAWCEDHLPVARPAAWRAITEREENPPHSIGRYLARTFGGREHLADYLHGRADEYGGREAVREHAWRMSHPMTPNGFAWTGGIGGNVGAPCTVCGKEC